MNREIGGGWTIGLVVVCLFGLDCPADDFSTTNREALPHFWRAAEEKQRPVTVLSFGDSMADSYRSPSCYLMGKLEARLGTAGYSFNNYRNQIYIQASNGTTVVPASPLWFTDHLSVPPGGSVAWQNQTSPGGVQCDQAGIFYVRQPQGGLIALLVSTNGGPWGTNLLLDGYSPAPVGVYTNVDLAPNLHRLRADGLTGTNYILGPQVLMAHTNGVHVSFIEQAGIPVSLVTNVPLAIRTPVFAALKPDLIVWHMKEEIAPLADWLQECEHWWTNAWPECDVLYVGTPWTLYDNTDTRTPDQNRVVRAEALRLGRAYVDLMQPGVSYNWLVAQGLISADGVHPTNAGGQWGANLIWNDMNFFALGLPRELSLEWTNCVAQIGFATAPGATYSLQSSTNLQTWLTELAVPGTGGYHSTNLVPAQPQGFYRLRLTP